MSPEKQRIKIAEACGHNLFVLHKPIHDPFGYYRENACGYTNNLSEAWKVPWEVAKLHIAGRDSDPDKVVAKPAPLPDYLNDLNAMHDAENSLSPEKIADYALTLCDMLHVPDFDPEFCVPQWPAINATASQRAEAFLRTLNLWEEE